jgi:hypothetical protein
MPTTKTKNLLRHICSKEELWSQKKRPFPGNSAIKSSDLVFIHGPRHVPTTTGL